MIFLAGLLSGGPSKINTTEAVATADGQSESHNIDE